MSDERPDLLVPDRSIVSLEQAKRELLEKKERRGTSPNNDFVTKGELLKIMDVIGEGISTAALAVGEKMYDQASGELAENFDDFALQIEQRIRQQFERQSLRYRVRQWWRARFGTADVRIVDPVEALDPNVVHAALQAAPDDGPVVQPAPQSTDVAIVHTH